MSGTSYKNFIPGSTVSVSATTTTARATLGTSPVTRRDVLMHNAGTTLVFFKFGDSTVTATTSDTPLPAGAYAIFHANDHTHVACITSTGSATVYATVGFGD